MSNDYRYDFFFLISLIMFLMASKIFATLYREIFHWSFIWNAHWCCKGQLQDSHFQVKLLQKPQALASLENEVFWVVCIHLHDSRGCQDSHSYIISVPSGKSQATFGV